MAREYEPFSSPGAPECVERGCEVLSPPAPQQAAAVSSGGGTQGKGDVVYEHSWRPVTGYYL